MRSQIVLAVLVLAGLKGSVVQSQTPETTIRAPHHGTCEMGGADLQRQHAVRPGYGLAANEHVGGESIEPPDVALAATAACGKDWARADSRASLEAQALTWTGSQLVAAGSNGRIWTSPDGSTWRNRFSGTSAGLSGLAWTGSRVIAVGSNGTILTSPDGAVWTKRAAGMDYTLWAVTWTGSQLVAVGSSGTILTSPDGTIWTSRASGTGRILYAIAWTGSQLVAVGAGVFGGQGGTILTSPDGVTWTAREPSASRPDSLYGVAWTGSQLVAVGSYGVLRSPDGVTWTNSDFWFGYRLRAVVWTGSQLVAVGSGSSSMGSARILTSPDGVTWTGRFATDIIGLDAIAWTGSQLVAAGAYGGPILTSPDGVAWTDRTPTSGINPVDMVWTGSKYVGVGRSGAILTSPDGVTWAWISQAAGSTIGTNSFSAIAWTGTQLVVVCEYGGRILTSPDGVTWTLRTSGTGRGLLAVVWTGSQLVAVGWSGTIVTSPDGITWTSRGDSSEIGRISSIAWTGSQLVAVGDYLILTSPDGVTWTRQTWTAGSSSYFRDVTWTGSQLVAVSEKGDIMTSPDGTIWTNRASGTDDVLAGVVWTGSQLVAVGWGGTIVTSPDGITWTRQYSGTRTFLSALFWTGSQLVAVGSSGSILTSPDGAVWTLRSPRELSSLWGVTWSGTGFVAVGDHGTIRSSPTGVEWQPRSAGTNSVLNGVAWAGSQLVAVGDNGTILTSPDGLTWAARTSGRRNFLVGVAWTGSMLVAVGGNGTILTSPNGVTWTSRTSGTTNHLYGVAWTGSQLVAVGDAGAILTSPDGQTWTVKSSGQPTTAVLTSVIWAESYIVAVGYDSKTAGALVLTSQDGSSWTVSLKRTTRTYLQGVTWTGSMVVAVGYVTGISPDGLTWSLLGAPGIFNSVAWSGTRLVAVGENGVIALSDCSEDCVRPSITTEPQSQTIAVGRTATLTVAAGGPAPLSYQWYQGASGDASHPVGTDSGTFTTPPLIATASYWVRVTNSCDSVDSATAVVTVGPGWASAVWVPVASHAAGLNQSQWRSDLGLLNPGDVSANVQVHFFSSSGVVSNNTTVAGGEQVILEDVVGHLPASGSGAIQVLSDQPLVVTSRTFNQVAANASCYPDGTQGQNYPALVSSSGSAGLSAGEKAYLAGLTENTAYRTNIGLVNTGPAVAAATVELHDGAGGLLATYHLTLDPGAWRQATQPFKAWAGQTAMDRGYAKVYVTSGSGVFAFASVIDNVTNDPTTVAMHTDRTAQSLSAAELARRSYTSTVWVPVASHTPGLNRSQWRSNLGLLNPGMATANAEITFFGSGGPSTKTTFVAAGAQSILVDVVGQLSASGSGAIRVLSDQPVIVTSRTYNQVSSTASCYPNGTQGQDYPALASGGGGLAAGQSAYLSGLRENAAYRTNIGLVNTGSAGAEVVVELHDGAGSILKSFSLSLASGAWQQVTQPFRTQAGQTAMDRGYAKVRVTTGSGVFAFASVVDNITNDPTTVTMQP